MRGLRTLLPLSVTLGLALLGGPVAAGDLVVIVHPDSGVQSLNHDQVVNLFLGRLKRLPSGLIALPVEDARIRGHFYKVLVRMELPDINAYWARLLYSGQAQPPRQGSSAQEVLDMVATNKGAIGVLDAAMVDRRVRIVLHLGE